MKKISNYALIGFTFKRELRRIRRRMPDEEIIKNLYEAKNSQFKKASQQGILFAPFALFLLSGNYESLSLSIFGANFEINASIILISVSISISIVIANFEEYFILDMCCGMAAKMMFKVKFGGIFGIFYNDSFGSYTSSTLPDHRFLIAPRKVRTVINVSLAIFSLFLYFSILLMPIIYISYVSVNIFVSQENAIYKVICVSAIVILFMRITIFLNNIIPWKLEKNVSTIRWSFLIKNHNVQENERGPDLRAQRWIKEKKSNKYQL